MEESNADICEPRQTIYPMLVVFSIGLWVFSLMCDLIGMSVATTGRLVVGGALHNGRRLDRRACRSGAWAVRLAHDYQSYHRRAVRSEYLTTHERSGRHEGAIVLPIIGVCMIAVPGWLGGQMAHVYDVGFEGRE